MHIFLKLILLTGLGFLLMATGYSNLNGNLMNYWDNPTATSHHDWSALENNMRPEACAQCHESQFNSWKHSQHANAFSPGLIGQFPDIGHMEGNNCLRCHAPLSEQLYQSPEAMLDSLKILKEHPQGIHPQADLDSTQAKLPLRHAGVTCAVCHVRNGNRFGPPRKNNNTLGHIQTQTHGGFTASRQFQQSGFCAECHQFPQSYAINGKPLENTVVEWQQSRFAREGKQCQSCHMPDRKHAFKGIHDKAFTLSGLEIQASLQQGMATLELTSKNIGHAFPTYVTPKIIIQATALNKRGKTLKTWQWEIVREVFYANGWQEKQDSRLLPDETRIYVAKHPPKQTASIYFQIKVIPDYFYKGVYQSLLSEGLVDDADVLIQHALTTANQNNYVLFSESVEIPKALE